MACSPICQVPVKFAQYIYFGGFMLTAIASWLLRDYGGNALDFSPLNECLGDTTGGGEPQNRSCLGQQAVLRIAFGNFMLFSLHLLLLLGVTLKTNPRLVVHTGFWPFKFLLWGGLIGCTFAMDNGVLEGFGQAARVFSGFFIIIQLVILLDFVYVVNEWLLEREQCGFVLIGGSALMIAGSFVGIGFLYHYYAPAASCSLNIWFITSAILFFLIYGFISISPLRNESAGLFTSAAVFTYTVYYTWSALNSEPTTHACAAAASAGGNSKSIQIIGFVIAIITLGVSTMSSGTSSQAFDLTGGSGGEDDTLPYRPDFFHTIFLLASCYMMMLFIGWDLAAVNGEFSLDTGWGSTWVKIIAAWLCSLMYTWSLVAHRVLTNRQF